MSKVNEKRAKGKASFQLKLSTIDHFLTTMHIAKHIWDLKVEKYGVILSISKMLSTLIQVKNNGRA